MFSPNFSGQLTVEQMVDRYDLACQPVRDLIVDYLRERQPGIDYATLRACPALLARAFWKDLENHHPGISSLRLPPTSPRLEAAPADQAARSRPARRDGCESPGTAEAPPTT